MNETSELILNFVLNACWQIVVIFAVAAIGSRLLSNSPASYRYALWIVALVACLIVPLLSATHFIPAWVVPAGVSQVKEVIPKTQPSIAPRGDYVDVDDVFSGDLLVTQLTKPISTTTRTAVFLTLAYVLLVFGCVIRLARFWRRKETLRRSATRAGLPPEVELLAQRCRRIFAVDAPVMRSDKARVPYTIGARRPLILLPAAFCSAADETRLLSVIAHEMAHVARRDFLSNLICELISLPIAFHPLTFVMKRQIERTRELACDELVTSHLLAPRVYARSLLWAADISRQYSSQAFMLSIFDGKILEERIMRLTKNKTRLGAGPARVLMLAALLVLCVSAMSLSRWAISEIEG